MTAKPNQKTNNFHASYMMEVEDDNVYYWANDNRCVRVLRARWSIRGKVQIRILTSGTSEIVKLTKESAKYTVMKTGIHDILGPNMLL